MKKSRKEFIREAHNHACSEWKQKIENEFPNLFKTTELEVGKWIKDNNEITGWMAFWDKNGSRYGFDFKGDWFFEKKANGNLYSYGHRLATKEEVESALIKEAKRRGFKKGVRFKCAYDDYITTYCGDYDFELKNVFDFKTEIICENSEGYIFSGGKWATIVETITKEEAEKQLGKLII